MKIDNTTAAVVTGGASGLGKASAEALARLQRVREKASDFRRPHAVRHGGALQQLRCDPGRSVALYW